MVDALRLSITANQGLEIWLRLAADFRDELIDLQLGIITLQEFLEFMSNTSEEYNVKDLDVLFEDTTSNLLGANSYVANASVEIQDVNDNEVILLSESLVEGQWSFDQEGNSFTHKGSAKFVVVQANISQQILSTANIQRPNPSLVLEKLIEDKEWVVVAESASGYIRDASGHERSSNSIFYRDISIKDSATYRLSSVQESTNGGVVTSRYGQFDLEAHI